MTLMRIIALSTRYALKLENQLQENLLMNSSGRMETKYGNKDVTTAW